MNEIKFRAWDGKKMINDALELSRPGVTGGGYTTAWKRGVEWMQFTGFTDKNDCEIYQGDIVSYKDIAAIFGEEKEPRPVFGTDWIDVVVYEYGAFAFDSIVTTFWNETKNAAGIKDWNFAKMLEVIGNVHQTPELLP